MKQWGEKPNFSTDFIKYVRDMHSFTATFSHLSGDPDLEYIYDTYFLKFINLFGTHYMYEVHMGAELSVMQHFYKEEINKGRVHNCHVVLLIKLRFWDNSRNFFKF